MNDSHHTSLKRYVNDVIAMERDIVNAVSGQIEDDRIAAYPELKQILSGIITEGESRITRLKKLTEEEGGSVAAAVKEGITSVTGALAGLYGKIREHAVSRMVRDDIIALDVATTSYGMLLTLALSIGHSECAALAEEGLRFGPPNIVKLTDLIPIVVAEELSKDAPLSNPAAPQVALAAIRDAWRRHE